MRQRKEDLEAVMEAPGASVRLAKWGGMAVLFNSLGKGTDFTPLLKGLKDDMCQCPHWGYVLKGALHIRYTDGREEVFGAGDLWYIPPGHTGWVEEDTDYIEFSPENEFAEVFDHVQSQMQ